MAISGQITLPRVASEGRLPKAAKATNFKTTPVIHNALAHAVICRVPALNAETGATEKAQSRLRRMVPAAAW